MFWKKKKFDFSFIKLSQGTAKENPCMIIREYDRMIRDIPLEILNGNININTMNEENQTIYKFETVDEYQAQNWMEANSMKSFIFDLHHNMFRHWEDLPDIDPHTLYRVKDEIAKGIEEYNIKLD